MNRKKNIILIGFMGSGKTTFGRWISTSHSMKFIDTDEYIEKKYNKLIKDIFRESGEEAFRNMETQAVRELADSCDNCVISVGGGLPVEILTAGFLKSLELSYILRPRLMNL